MKAPWRYWQLERLTMQRTRRVEELAPCRQWLTAHFPNPGDEGPPDAAVQRRLLALMASPVAPADAQLAEGCLRCFISHGIARTCEDLCGRFGQRAGICRVEDLLALVPTDSDPLRQRPTTPALADDPTLAGKILRTFQPDKAGLSAWTKRLVYSHRALNDYLQEHGVYLESDWSLLNGLTARRLRQLLIDHGFVAEADQQRAVAILQSYQTVYRGDRLRQRPTNRTRCEPPTPDQLARMVAHLQQHGILDVKADALLAQLEQWASLMRQARRPPLEPIDGAGIEKAIVEQSIDAQAEAAEQEAEAHQQAFLQQYRQMLVAVLDEAIAHTLDQRVARLAKKKHPKDAAFLKGLRRFFCHGETMRAIAPHLGLKAQFQVSRLLDIGAIRADVHRQAHRLLKQRIAALATQYVAMPPPDAALDEALQVELDRLLAEAAAESFTPHSANRSLLNQRLCHHLSHRSDPQ